MLKNIKKSVHVIVVQKAMSTTIATSTSVVAASVVPVPTAVSFSIGTKVLAPIYWFILVLLLLLFFSS